MRKIFALAIILCSLMSQAQPLTGIKKIPGDYASFTSAFQALNANGVGNGGVTFLVKTDTTFYERPPALFVQGTANNPILFTKDGSGTNPIIIPDSAGTQDPSVYASVGDAIIRLFGVRYLTWESIDLRDNPIFGSDSARYENGVLIGRFDTANGTKQIYLKNSTIKLSFGYTQGKGIKICDYTLLGLQTAATSVDGAIENIHCSGLKIDSTFIGVYYNSSSSQLYLNRMDNEFSVDSCEITNFGGDSLRSSAGILMAGKLLNLRIHSNLIDGKFLNNYRSSGIAVAINKTNVEITNNTIRSIKASDFVKGISYDVPVNGAYLVENLLIRQNHINKLQSVKGGIIQAIWVVGRVHYLHVDSNLVDSASGTGAFQGLVASIRTDSVLFSSNTIQQVDMSGNCEGIFLVMTSTYEKFVHLKLNHINSIKSSGSVRGIVFDHNGTAGLIEHNDLNNFQAGSGERVDGVDLRGTGSVTVSANLVWGFHANRTHGITNTNNRVAYFFNNVVYGLYGDSLISGLYMDVYANTLGIHHNTIYLDKRTISNANFNSSCVHFAYSALRLDFNNNILINLSDSASSGYSTAIWTGHSSWSSILSLASGHNIYYTGSQGARRPIYLKNNSVPFVTMEDYLIENVGRDQTSNSESCIFKNTSQLPYDLSLDTSIVTRVEDGGLAILAPLINEDFFGRNRDTVRVDIGAYEGQYIGGDTIPPIISFDSTVGKGFLDTTRLIRVIIRDQSGINMSPDNEPRLYYKKSTDINAVISNDSNSGGWKWVSGIPENDSVFNFTLDYRFLNSALKISDVIEYFVVAADSSPFANVTVEGWNIKARPTSTHLKQGHLIWYYPNFSFTFNYPVGGTYTVGLGGDFESLTDSNGLFAFLNGKMVAEPIQVKIISDLVEKAEFPLEIYERYQGRKYPIYIMPDTSLVRVIRASDTAHLFPLIRIWGSEDVHIDGSYNGEGAYLHFKSISTFQSGNTLINIDKKLQSPRYCNSISVGNCLFSDSFDFHRGVAISVGRSSYTSDIEDDQIHSVRIYNNSFKNFNTKIRVRGNRYTWDNMYNILIEGNRIEDFDLDVAPNYQQHGIRIDYADSVIVRNNVIKDCLYGFPIYLDEVQGYEINSNQITNYKNSLYEGSGILIDNYTNNAKSRIANNFISGGKAGGGFHIIPNCAAGISLKGTSVDLALLNNSVYLTDTINSIYPIYTAALYVWKYSGTRIKNNSFYNLTTNTIGNANVWGIYARSNIKFGSDYVDMDYNNIVCSDSGDVLGYESFHSVSDLQAAYPGVYDNIISCDPLHYNENDPRTAATCLMAAGDTTELEYDIFGNQRNKNQPSIGAYEYVEKSHDLVVTSFHSLNTCTSDSIVYELVVLNAGLDSATNYQGQLTINGPNPFTYVVNSPRTLHSKQRDTFFIPLKFANPISDLDIQVRLNYFFDEDTTNNSMSYQMRLNALPVLSIISDTMCRGSQAFLKGTSSIPSEIHWYLDSSLTNYFGVGASINSIPVWDTLNYFAIAIDTMYGCKSFTQALAVFHKDQDILNLGADKEVCSGDSVQLSSTYNYTSYLWSTQDSNASIYVSSSGRIGLTVVDSMNCIQYDTVDVAVSDCVWPGDADNNGVANNLDVLQLGVYYSTTGGQRNNASLNWSAQYITDWGNPLAGNPDPKFSDCNGDGTVSLSDTLAISQNYGLMHQKKTGGIEGQPGDIPFYLQFAQDSIMSEMEVYADLILSDAKDVAGYAVAFSIDIPSFVQNGSMVFVPTSSWLLDSNGTSIFFKHFSTDSTRIDFALTRTDKQNAHGMGKIGEIHFNTKYFGDPFAFTMVPYGLRFIENEGNIIPIYNSPKDSAHVIINPNALPDIDEKEIKLYPNPSSGSFKIDGENLVNVMVYNELGQEMKTKVQLSELAGQVDIVNPSPGIYHLLIETDTAVFRRKIIIQ